MFLTYSVAPFWALLISSLTFYILKTNDPVDLSTYQEKMLGIPPAICCLSLIAPLMVLFLYGVCLRLGPKGAKVAIKM